MEAFCEAATKLLIKQGRARDSLRARQTRERDQLDDSAFTASEATAATRSEAATAVWRTLWADARAAIRPEDFDGPLSDSDDSRAAAAPAPTPAIASPACTEL